MANYHILDGLSDGNAYRVAFHIAIPNTNNRVAVNHRAAVVAAGLNTTIMVEGNGAGQITTAEKTQVTAGELVEYVEDFHTQPGETSNQLRDRIDARYTALITIVQTRLANRLAYFGFTRNVP